MNTFDMINFLVDYYSKMEKVLTRDYNQYFKGYPLYIEVNPSCSTNRKLLFAFSKIGNIVLTTNNKIEIFLSKKKFLLEVEVSSWENILQNKHDLRYLTLMTKKGVECLFDDIWPNYIPTELNYLYDKIKKGE